MCWRLQAKRHQGFDAASESMHTVHVGTMHRCASERSPDVYAVRAFQCWLAFSEFIQTSSEASATLRSEVRRRSLHRWLAYAICKRQAARVAIAVVQRWAVPK